MTAILAPMRTGFAQDNPSRIGMKNQLSCNSPWLWVEILDAQSTG